MKSVFFFASFVVKKCFSKKSVIVVKKQKVMNVVFEPVKEASKDWHVRVTGRDKDVAAATKFLTDEIIVNEVMDKVTKVEEDQVARLRVRVLRPTCKGSENFFVKAWFDMSAMKAWWISVFGYILESNEAEMRPAGTFVRMARDVDYDPEATVRVTLAALADAPAFAKFAKIVQNTKATLKEETVSNVSARTPEFFYGHRCENLRTVQADKKSLILRRQPDDSTFYVVGRPDDVQAIANRFRRQKHIFLRVHNTSHIVGDYISTKRGRIEDIQIHLEPDNVRSTGMTAVRLLHRKHEKKEGNAVAAQSFTSVLEELDIYEIVLEVPAWLWLMCRMSFRDKFEVFTTITERIDGARLFVFAGNRVNTIEAAEWFVSELRRWVTCPIDGFFLREISAQHSLPSEKPPPVFPLEGFVPSADAQLPNVDENAEHSFYWRR